MLKIVLLYRLLTKTLCRQGDLKCFAMNLIEILEIQKGGRKCCGQQKTRDSLQSEPLELRVE